MRWLLLALMLLPVPALADCPALPDRGAEKRALLADLRRAPDEAAAMAPAEALWRLWTTAPDAEAQALLDRGMARREAYDYAEAESVLDALIARCPAYAEGYNQRAFVRFLRETYDDALADIDATLAREPAHFGALAGRALVLMRMGRLTLGQAALRRALTVHPFLPERAMLLPEEGKGI